MTSVPTNGVDTPALTVVTAASISRIRSFVTVQLNQSMYLNTVGDSYLDPYFSHIEIVYSCVNVTSDMTDNDVCHC